MTVMINNRYEVDTYNNRIVCHLGDASEEEIIDICRLEEENQVGKTIIYTVQAYGEILQAHGYQQEGVINGYFNGEDGYVFTKFLKVDRERSSYQDANEKTMAIVNQDNKDVSDVKLDEDYQLVMAGEKDAGDLASIYKKVFKYYPSNVHDPEYLRRKIGDDYFFIMVKHGGTVVSVASAMVDPQLKSAEITDCATDPDYRGNGFLYPIITKLEKQLKKKGIKTFYSLTRAQSPGMNLTVKRLGYQYQGRLVNNCKIFSGYEDMNIWTKQG